MALLRTMLLLLQIFNAVQRTEAKTVMSLNWIYFTNPTGRDGEGNCCDGEETALGCILGTCDPYFTVCVDSPTGDQHSSTQCAFYKISTAVVDDKNTINMLNPLDLGKDFSNPLLIPLDTYQSSLRLKIFAYDDDTGSNDVLLDEFLVNYTQTSPYRSLGEAVFAAFNITGLTNVGQYFTGIASTALSVRVSMYCERNWYGLHCEVNCEPSDDCTGHYNCSQSDGSKLCLRGWTGPNCSVRNTSIAFPACPIANSCKYGGECIFVGPASADFYCCCKDGFSIPDCAQVRRCLNSTAPCLNGGSCSQVSATVARCTCPSPYMGTICETNLCASLSCRNGGVCQLRPDGVTVFCQCPPGFNGTFCENLRPCFSNPCVNGGSCYELGSAYYCSCSRGFTGLRCDVIIDPCNPNPCFNDGTCVATPPLPSITSRCQCLRNFTGIHCETHYVFACNQESTPTDRPELSALDITIEYGPRSDPVDNAMSEIRCQVGYAPIQCSCSSCDACDGARFDDDVCRAFASQQMVVQDGRGVVAKLYCKQLNSSDLAGPGLFLFSVTSAAGYSPQVSCPSGSTAIGCSQYSEFFEADLHGLAAIDKPSERCFLRSPCSGANCRVQVHCQVLPQECHALQCHPDEGNPSTETCFSQRGEANDCLLSDAFFQYPFPIQIVLSRELSGPGTCRWGDTWGLHRRHIWVQKGCQAEFSVTVLGRLDWFRDSNTVVVYGNRSSVEDDATSEVSCPSGYYAFQCACTDCDKCDGAMFDGNVCKAYMSWTAANVDGAGVRAKVYCKPIPKGSTDVAFDATSSEDFRGSADPEVACPGHTRIIGCSVHSYWFNTDSQGWGIMDVLRNTCSLDAPCTQSSSDEPNAQLGCRVQARCLGCGKNKP